jgi:hypothetical protein
MASCSPWIRASYLFVACQRTWRTYLSYFPSRDMKRTPVPTPPSLSDPSKYIFQWSRMVFGVSCWISVHSAMKSVSAWDLMALRGVKSMFSAPSSTAHLEMWPVASLLHRISLSGKICYHCDLMTIEVVSQLAGGDQEGIEYFLNMWIPDLWVW